MRDSKGRFVIGHKVNLGKKASPEKLEHLRLSHLGIQHTEETKRKIRETCKRKGLKPPNWTGQKWSKERRLKCCGPNSSWWKGGITPHNKLIRHSAEYISWRTSVFKRDNYTCIWCGARNQKGHQAVRLNADHIKPFAHFPELRFDIDNGRTLCTDCHEKTPTFKRKVLVLEDDYGRI